ncbi:MAG: erythromycin esterase family protein [Nitrospirota bacterium]|nr:erythromycin esterase family protein [Nitrospirota bacterium]
MKSVSTGRITGAIERKVVQPALAESYEALLHHVGLSRFLLTWKEASLVDELRDRRLKGAIGVIYLPKTERLNHYFCASLPAQFDVVIHSTKPMRSNRWISSACGRRMMLRRRIRPAYR